MSPAFDRALDGAHSVAKKKARLISIISVAAFVLSAANDAGFIDLPKIMPTGLKLAVTAIWNAIWWGVLRPRMLARSQGTYRG